MTDALEWMHAITNISEEVSEKYGPQAGATIREILIGLDEVPTVILLNKGVCFPIWRQYVRTINPKALRNPSNSPEIRYIVDSALYCMNPPTEVYPSKSESAQRSSSALKVFSILNGVSDQ